MKVNVTLDDSEVVTLIRMLEIVQQASISEKTRAVIMLNGQINTRVYPTLKQLREAHRSTMQRAREEIPSAT